MNAMQNASDGSVDDIDAIRYAIPYAIGGAMKGAIVTLRLPLLVVALLAPVGLVGCNLEVGDLNNASTDELADAPSVAAVLAAATGLLIGHRERIGDQNGFVALVGVLGREGYNLNVETDARFITEMLEGEVLDPGSPRFGGNFWADRYANIRNGNVVLGAVEKVVAWSDEQKAAVRGFTRTIQALDYLILIATRDEQGVALEVDRPFGADLAPVRCKDAALAFVAELLDTAADDLAAAGELEAFPMPMSSGFDGFDSPATFALVNRAVAARAAIYAMDGAAALAALEGSFITVDEADPQLGRGVYHAFGTGAGDTRNGLNDPNIYAHPSVAASAEDGDLRIAAKIRAVADDETDPAKRLPEDGIEAVHKFTSYPDATSRVPIIRNEELVLIRAEARILTGDLEGAADDINYIRRVSGGLADRMDLTTEDALIDALLAERFLSLLFEGGHRWIDMRRWGRLDQLPVDAADHTVHAFYPIPVAETDARGGSVSCQP